MENSPQKVIFGRMEWYCGRYTAMVYNHTMGEFVNILLIINIKQSWVQRDMPTSTGTRREGIDMRSCQIKLKRNI